MIIILGVNVYILQGKNLIIKLIEWIAIVDIWPDNKLYTKINFYWGELE